MAQTSNEAASQLPTRTAILQRPSADTPQGASHGSGHGAASSSTTKSDAPQLPASSSANGSSPPIAALPSPTTAVAALPPAPTSAPSAAPSAPPQLQPSVSGNNGGLGGGVRGWIDGLRGYRWTSVLIRFWHVVPTAGLDATTELSTSQRYLTRLSLLASHHLRGTSSADTAQMQNRWQVT